MTKIRLETPTVLADGILKTDNPINASLQVVKDQENNESALEISTDETGLKASSTATTQTTAVIQATDTNSGIAIVPNGTGAFTLDVPDGTATGGNARGDYAIDLQMVRGNANEVAAGTRCIIIGGANNEIRSVHNDAGIIGGINNTIYGSSNYNGASFILGGDSNNLGAGAQNFCNILGGQSNNITNGSNRSVVVGGQSNTINGSSYSVISGGQSNTASTSSYATVVGGYQNSSTGQYSVSGGYSNVASGQGAVALGYDNTASGIRSIAIGDQSQSTDSHCIAIGRKANATGQYSICINSDFVNGASSGVNSIVLGGRTNANGLESIAFGKFGNALGEQSVAIHRGRSYLKGQFSYSQTTFSTDSPGLVEGKNQYSIVKPYKEDTLTTGATTTLSLDGTGTNNLIIPDGNNRVWNVTVKYTAVVTLITGTATGVSVGDCKNEVLTIGFKKIGGISQNVGAINIVSTNEDASMNSAVFGISAGPSQEMKLDFSAPIFIGGGSLTIRVVAKVELTEVAY